MTKTGVRLLTLGIAAVAGIAGLAFLLRDPDCAATQHMIRREDVPHLQALIREDFEREATGLQTAATRLSRGFSVEDSDRREREMRRALTLLTQPPRAIRELLIAPRTFIAVADSNAVIICRDGEADRMAGQDTRAFAPSVLQAIRNGRATSALVDWPNLDPTQPPTALVLEAVPVRLDGVVVGAVLAGTPLWAISRRLTRQLQAESATTGQIVWVYLYRGNSLERRGTPENLDQAIPDTQARARGLSISPGGFTGTFAQFGQWYAYGVVPLPQLASDVGFVVVRSDVES